MAYEKQSLPSDREKTGLEAKKIHAGHENRNLMPGMTFFLVSTQSSLGRARFHARHEIWLCMPGMKIGFTCPAWKSAFHARHENRLCMASVKIDSTCRAWKPTWKLPGINLLVKFELKRSVAIKSVFYSGWNGIFFSTFVSKLKEICWQWRIIKSPAFIKSVNNEMTLGWLLQMNLNSAYIRPHTDKLSLPEPLLAQVLTILKVSNMDATGGS